MESEVGVDRFGVIDKDDEAEVERLFKELREAYKLLDVPESNVEERSFNGSYQIFIKQVTSMFHCEEQELNKNPITAALLAKYREDTKITLDKVATKNVRGQLLEAGIAYEDGVIEIIGKYIKQFQQQQLREKIDDSQEWLKGAFPIGTISSSSKKKKKKKQKK